MVDGTPPCTAAFARRFLARAELELVGFFTVKPCNEKSTQACHFP